MHCIRLYFHYLFCLDARSVLNDKISKSNHKRCAKDYLAHLVRVEDYL